MSLKVASGRWVGVRADEAVRQDRGCPRIGGSGRANIGVNDVVKEVSINVNIAISATDDTVGDYAIIIELSPG